MRASSSPEYTFATALHIPSYLFLATIVAMFFGLTGAASEVLKDRALLKRESNAKVFVTGYVLAKALVLTGLSAVQSALSAVSRELLASHIRTCVVEDIRKGDTEVVDDLVATIQKMMK